MAKFNKRRAEPSDDEAVSVKPSKKTKKEAKPAAAEAASTGGGNDAPGKDADGNMFWPVSYPLLPQPTR